MKPLLRVLVVSILLLASLVVVGLGTFSPSSTVRAQTLSSVCANFSSASGTLLGTGDGNGIVGTANPGEVFTITFSLGTATSATIRMFGGYPGDVLFAGPTSVPGTLSYTVPSGGLPPGAIGVGFNLNYANGTVIVQASCGTPQVTWCNLGGDGRVDGTKCWERIVVYCNTSNDPPTLDLWGVGLDSKGFRLTTFSFSDLSKAGPKGLTKDLGKLGKVSAAVDAQNNFWVAWNGQVSVPSGSFYADGQPNHGFAKGFSCNFKR